MASNPMQRKSRISFLIGVITTLLIAVIIIAVIYTSMSKNIEGLEAELSHFGTKNVYVFTQDVKAGQVIDPETMLSPMNVDDRVVPVSATSSFTSIQDYTLTDKEGNAITWSGTSDNMKYIYNDGTGNPKELQLSDVADAETGSKIFYYEQGGQKVVVETAGDPLIAKVDIKANSVFSFDSVSRGSDTLTNDARWQEYNMLSLPSDLVSGDTVDIRLQLPTGEDFIVLSKKKVTFPGAEEEGDVPTVVSDVIRLSVDEAETLTMSSAIVDSYQIIGSKLYVVKYTEPGIQEAAVGTYSPSGSTIDLIQKDPNIVARAIQEIVTRQQQASSNELRESYINAAIRASGEEGQDAINTKQQESITKSQTTRQTYLDTLGG